MASLVAQTKAVAGSIQAHLARCRLEAVSAKCLHGLPGEQVAAHLAGMGDKGSPGASTVGSRATPVRPRPRPVD